MNRETQVFREVWTARGVILVTDVRWIGTRELLLVEYNLVVLLHVAPSVTVNAVFLGCHPCK